MSGFVEALIELEKLDDMAKNKFEWDDDKVREFVARYWSFPVADMRRFIGVQIASFKEEQEQKRKPLFVTEDGVEIFDGQRFYEVSLVDFAVLAESALHQPPYDKYYKYFSTEEKANEYVLMNKPLLSLEEVFGVVRSVKDGVRGLDDCKSVIKEMAKQLAKSKLNAK